MKVDISRSVSINDDVDSMSAVSSADIRVFKHLEKNSSISQKFYYYFDIILIF